MTAEPGPRRGWEMLAGPGQVNQRRYEALRAYLHDGASLRQAADATGYTRAALASLVRDLRAGRLTLLAPPGAACHQRGPRTTYRRRLLGFRGRTLRHRRGHRHRQPGRA